MILTNENRPHTSTPYDAINSYCKATVSPGINVHYNRNRNNENFKSLLETENKLLREKLALKEKEIFRKDKTIKDLQDKISKMEIENKNLKGECDKINISTKE